ERGRARPAAGTALDCGVAEAERGQSGVERPRRRPLPEAAARPVPLHRRGPRGVQRGPDCGRPRRRRRAEQRDADVCRERPVPVARARRLLVAAALGLTAWAAAASTAPSAASCRNLASPPPKKQRSEEHTSELQSRGHLVCRLLLEKET